MQAMQLHHSTHSISPHHRSTHTTPSNSNRTPLLSLGQPAHSSSLAPWQFAGSQGRQQSHTQHVLTPPRSESSVHHNHQSSAAAAPAPIASLPRLQPADLISQIAAPVADDMTQMNHNLRHIVGDRSPMLMAAADQIFGAGGKKLRPMIVFLVARATAHMAGMK